MAARELSRNKYGGMEAPVTLYCGVSASVVSCHNDRTSVSSTIQTGVIDGRYDLSESTERKRQEQ